MNNNEYLKDLPICEPFFIFKCSVCGAPYGEDFARDNEHGIPVYYQWNHSRPLTIDEFKQALTNKLKVNWFCSATCSSSLTNQSL